ncbi:MAG: succinylglutamate desuccinylase/aspartoacylase family protein, partial [Thermoanaerobaculia bacterium]|nr:succinylglutamate desuccinylase/aspartoacylase family protein [Thermoanaerobaculia bacterium]
SLRAAARKKGAHVLVYEAGGPQRFDEDAIATGVTGILRVLRALEIWPRAAPSELGVEAPPSFEATSTRWIRAPRSGIFYIDCGLGERVDRKQVLGRVRIPFGGRSKVVRAPFDGLVIGYSSNPLVHQGDALVHLARGRDEEEPSG